MQPLTRALTDADKGIDFTQCIQGHVSQSIKQVFTTERSRSLRNDSLQINAEEHIVKDQFGNLYVVFTANLIDDEVYACTAWVGAEKWTGTEKTLVLVKEFKKFKTFNDSLLAMLQGIAFLQFGKETITILKGRNAANMAAVGLN
jgi:hypothetical protein